MLENLIKKYKYKDVSQVVYRLTYAGKFIVIKGNTLAGSLMTVAAAFKGYSTDSVYNVKYPKDYSDHLYKHFYDHYLENEGVSRFRIKTLAKKGRKITQYNLLKREQMELDKHRYTSQCLNNAVEAYIPQYRESTGSYGWIDKSDVMNFKRWLVSKERKAYVRRYSKTPDRVLATSDPSN